MKTISDFPLTISNQTSVKQNSDSEKNGIPLLADVLQIPADLVCSQGTIFGGLEGLCILLRRLAYPCRYSDLLQRCGQ